jgi:hypothetical protein
MGSAIANLNNFEEILGERSRTIFLYRISSALTLIANADSFFARSIVAPIINLSSPIFNGSGSMVTAFVSLL